MCRRHVVSLVLCRDLLTALPPQGLVRTADRHPSAALSRPQPPSAALGRSGPAWAAPETAHYGTVTAGGCQGGRGSAVSSARGLTPEVRLVPDPLPGAAQEPDRPHPVRHRTATPRVVQPA